MAMPNRNQNFDNSTIPPMPPLSGMDFQQEQTPVSLVLNMQQQGMQNNQIVQNLTQQGFTPEQINDAINMSEARGAVGFQQIQQERQQNMPPPPPFKPEFSSEDDRIEELAEAIIDEKWKDLSKNIDKIIDWKDRTEEKIGELESQFEDIKKGFDSLHQAILGKVSEYDQNIVSLGSEIKAMEKVFQKLLPTFTENVNELSKLTKDLKKKS